MPWCPARSPGYIGIGVFDCCRRTWTLPSLVQEGRSSEARDREDVLERLAFSAPGRPPVILCLQTSCTGQPQTTIVQAPAEARSLFRPHLPSKPECGPAHLEIPGSGHWLQQDCVHVGAWRDFVLPQWVRRPQPCTKA